jgi:hypothetical protein
MGRDDHDVSPSILVSSRGFFEQIVTESFERRKLRTFPLVKDYLIDLLESYIPTENLFDDIDSSGRRVRETLAEMLLRAQSADALVRIELLRKLGDRSLYISGFFADSLQRKLVDVDYYAEMGCTAYGALSGCVREDTMAKVYREMAGRFGEFAEVLTDISAQAHVSNEENIMRLYEVYARTGSELARERLIAKGLIAVPAVKFQSKKQQ